ncbi:GAF domain-containing protein [uncultured Desulfuromonas sp.]|uniref:GAF domain-containing protein n=1 Tax=uncultured Desulfuromonas sp. TaxID=181013 RepID=UPI002AABA0FE|nr:GAF domain-containing protein [uncultured Desulfuromonas sp.]
MQSPKVIFNRKLLLQLVLFLASVVALFVLFWNIAIIPYYIRLEEREARYSATVVKLAFERELESLKQLVIGYAAGLGTRSVDTNNPQAWKAFFNQDMLSESQVAAVAVLGLDGRCLFSQVAEDGNGDLSDSFQSKINNDWLRQIKKYPSVLAGYFADEQSWYLVSGTYIGSTAETAPNHLHYLLFFRTVDDALVYTLSRQFRFKFKLNYPVASTEPHLQSLSRSQPVVVDSATDDFSNVYFKLEDVYKQRTALVQTFFPRDHILQLRHGSLIHLSFFGAVFFFMGIVLIVIVRSSVKKPFKELSEVVHSLRSEKKARLPIADFEGREVVSLVSEFNLLLDDLEQSKIHQFCSEQKSDLIQRVVPSAIFTVNVDKVVTSWNRCAERLTGYQADEMIGNECFLFAEKPCQENCGLFDDTVPKPIMARECTIRRKDGKLIQISKNVDFLKDTQGRVIGGIECFEDISDRKSSEQALQWELALNIRLANLSRSIIHAPSNVEEIADELLDHARNLTNSPHGFVAMRWADGPQRFLAQTPLFSESLHNRQSSDSFVSENRHSLLNCVYHYRDHVCFNDLDSLEMVSFVEGANEKINHFLALPIFDGDDHLLGQLALANKSGGYAEHDRQAVEQLVELFTVVLINYHG